MIYLIVGHQGSGKTSLLKRLKNSFKNSLFFDLDQDIEKDIQKLTSNLSKKNGEKTFYRPKKNTFKKICKKISLNQNQTQDDNLFHPHSFISVSPNFKEKIPQSFHILWIQRPTDSNGRILTHESPFNPSKKQKNPLREYFHLFSNRNNFFKKIADEELIINEGFHKKSQAFEKLFFGLKKVKKKMKGSLTLREKNLKLKEKFLSFIKKRLSWGLCFFEIRDDLLSKEKMNLALNLIPEKNILFSFRKNTLKNKTFQTKSIIKIILNKNILWDWPIENGICPFGSPPLLSLHRREKNEKVKAVAKKLTDFSFKKDKKSHFTKYKKPHLKLSIPIQNLNELLEGHKWYLEDPAFRSFLPRSENGRWSWYRLLHKDKMKINFFRESLYGMHDGVLDQPFAMEWEDAPSEWSSFACILGNPINHSLTPIEQRPFAKKYSLPLLRIPLDEKECNKKSLNALFQLGLSFAAVTSPLKKKIYELCNEKSKETLSLQSVNTLILKEEVISSTKATLTKMNLKKSPSKKTLLTKAENKNINFISKGFNTDIYALKVLFKKWLHPKKKGGKPFFSGKNIAVWGGGGLLLALKETLPEAFFYSSRKGILRSKSKTFPFKQENPKNPFSPEILVWAVGRKRHNPLIEPPLNWKPHLVLDLNYTEDSPGKEYALRTNTLYQSGLEMFSLQAKRQRELWEENL